MNLGRIYGTTAAIAVAALGGPASAQEVQPAAGSPGSRVETPGTISEGAPAATAGSPGVPDATSGAAQLQDIIVTAQRREENLQRAAVSVTALSNDALVQKAVSNIAQLTQLAPALRAIPGQGAYVNYAIRGINNFSANSFGDSAIVVNSNGVPLAHPTGAHGLFYDVERVEVLKGPQGTLYGRNATGGAVNVISAKPTPKLGGYANFEYGNFDKKLATAALNVPLTEGLYARLAGQFVRRDGYYKDGTSDENSESVRLSFRFNPGPKLTADLVADYSHDGGVGPGTALIANRDVLGGPVTGLHFVGGDAWAGNLSSNPAIRAFYAPYTVRRGDVPYQRNKFYGLTGTINLTTDLGTLTVIPAYRKTNVNYVGNTPTFYLGEHQKSDQYSGEARFASTSDHAIRYLVGAFYLKDKLNSDFITENLPTALSNQFINNTGKTYAFFGQLTWALTETFRLTGGLRYTHERKTTDSIRRDLGFGGVGPVNFLTFNFNTFPGPTDGTLRFMTTAAASFHATNWKVGGEWDIAPRSLLYANAGTGFKAGGFFFGPTGSNTYRPERVTAYTIGSKNRFLDNRLQLNAEAFLYKYKDQQISHFSIFPAPFGNIFVTDNAGDSTIYGAELAAEYLLTTTTRLRLQAQYLHGKYDKLQYLSPTSLAATSKCPSPATTGGFLVDCSGRRLLYTPRVILAGGIDQTFRFANGSKVVASLDSRYESARETQLNYIPETRAPSYSKTDATLTWLAPRERYSIGVFVQNIEDSKAIATTGVGRNYSIANSGLIAATLQDPRIYGVRVGAKF